jgi:hypothetical protein
MVPGCSPTGGFRRLGRDAIVASLGRPGHDASGPPQSATSLAAGSCPLMRMGGKVRRRAPDLLLYSHERLTRACAVVSRTPSCTRRPWCRAARGVRYRSCARSASTGAVLRLKAVPAGQRSTCTATQAMSAGSLARPCPRSSMPRFRAGRVRPFLSSTQTQAAVLRGPAGIPQRTPGTRARSVHSPHLAGSATGPPGVMPPRTDCADQPPSRSPVSMPTLCGTGWRPSPRRAASRANTAP